MIAMDADSRQRFIEHLRNAETIVRDWPRWKRDVAERLFRAEPREHQAASDGAETQVEQS